MGTKNVFRVLQELFPQVDFCKQKVVSLKHPNDAGVSAGVVFAEIIGDDLHEHPLAAGSSSNSQSSLSFMQLVVKKKLNLSQLWIMQLLIHVSLNIQRKITFQSLMEVSLVQREGCLSFPKLDKSSCQNSMGTEDCVLTVDNMLVVHRMVHKFFPIIDDAEGKCIVVKDSDWKDWPFNLRTRANNTSKMYFLESFEPYVRSMKLAEVTFCKLEPDRGEKGFEAPRAVKRLRRLLLGHLDTVSVPSKDERSEWLILAK